MAQDLFIPLSQFLSMDTYIISRQMEPNILKEAVMKDEFVQGVGTTIIIISALSEWTQSTYLIRFESL
jgi:hypothetical protein